MNLRRTLTMSRKEFLHIVRDPRSLYMALAVPVLLLALFGTALSLDVDRILTLISDADQTAVSRELAEKFRGSRFFEVVAVTSDSREIARRIDRNQILIGVSIPRGYSRDLAAGRPASVQIVIDGSDSNTAAIALGYAETLLRNFSFEIRRDAQNLRGGAAAAQAVPVDTRLRVWYNSSLQSKNYVVPGLIAVILMIIAALLTSLTIAREWEMGTMEQLLSTPVRPAEIVLGKMFAFFVIGVADSSIAVFIGIVFFEVPFRGSGSFLMVSTCLYLTGVLFWGIFLSAATRNQLLAFQMGMISSFLPAFLLSGFVFALESMPPALQVVSLVVPARHMVTVLKGIFLKGVGPSVLWLELLVLFIFALIVFLASTSKLKQRVA
jgi:ABC-2 type transport system permease protein